MIKQIYNYVKAWIRGDDAELDIDFSFTVTWLDLGIIVGLILLGIYLWK